MVGVVASGAKSATRSKKARERQRYQNSIEHMQLTLLPRARERHNSNGSDKEVDCLTGTPRLKSEMWSREGFQATHGLQPDPEIDCQESTTSLDFANSPDTKHGEGRAYCSHVGRYAGDQCQSASAGHLTWT